MPPSLDLIVARQGCRLSRRQRRAGRAGLAWVGLILALAAPLPAGADGVQIVDIRVGRHPGLMRVVLDASGPAAFEPSVSADGRTVSVALHGVDWRPAPGRALAKAAPLTGYRFEAGGTGAGRLDLSAAQPVRLVAATALPADGRGRHRIVLDIASTAGGTAAGTAAPATDVPIKLAAKIEKKPAQPKPPKAAPAPLDGPKPLPADTDTPADIGGLLRDGNAGGTRAALQGRPVRPVTLRAVVGETLGQNYDILAAEEGVGAARSLVTRGEAAFDPTLFSSLNYTWTDSYKRTAWIGRLREPSEFEEVPDEDDPERKKTVPAPLPCVSVDGEPVDSSTESCNRPLEFRYQTELASGKPFNPGDNLRLNLGAGMRFPFGGQASLSVGTTYRKKYSFQAPFLTTALGPEDPFGWGSSMPWTSQASLAVSLPLPYTKGFGFEAAPDSVSLKLAQSGERRSVWERQSTRNSALAQALLAYWDLVENAERVRIFTDRRKTVEERKERIRRLFEQELTTAYEVEQVDVQLANLDSRQEIAWNQYQIASGRLSTLMAGEGRAVLVPADAAAALARPLRADTAGAHDRALDRHPDLKVQQETLDARKTTLGFRENQTLPDLTLSASFSVGQTDSAFGYRDPGTSLWKLSRPDTNNFFVGLRYVMPFGNTQAEAALSRARLEEKQAYDLGRETRQRVLTQTDRALHEFQSAEAVAGRSEEDLKLARFAYDRAVEGEDQGLVSGFEVINRFDDVLTAQLARTAARIALRKAHIRLLFAQGILEEEYTR